MNNLDKIEFSIGQKIRALCRANGERAASSIRGKVIYKNDFFITVKTKNYNVSIALFDFQCGMATLLRG